MPNVLTVAKAIAAGATAFAGAVVTAAPGGFTSTEWVTIAVATVTAALATWAVPNAAPSDGADGSVS